MSSRRRSPDTVADLVDAPFLDDAERAESEWLLTRDRDPSAPAPSRSIADDYEEMEELLGSLPAGAPDDRWHDEVLRIATSSELPSRSRPRRAILGWALGGTFASAAALAVILRVMRPGDPELEVATRHANEARDSDEIVVGDHLIVQARPRGGAGDLRIYQSDGTLVARCPGGPGCSGSSDDHYVIDILLEKPIQYQVILVVGTDDALPDLHEGPMNAYLEAARAANARIVMYRPLNVQ